MSGFIPEQPGPFEAEINRRLAEGDGEQPLSRVTDLSFDGDENDPTDPAYYLAHEGELDEEDVYRQIVRSMLIRLAFQYTVVLGVRYLAARATGRSFWTLAKKES